MSADAAPPPPRFRSVRFLARGGLGEVYVAEDLELAREVVVKTILPEHAGKPSAKTRFVREARLTALLEHPGVVPVYGFGTDPDGGLYYAMRFIGGRSMRDEVRGFHARRRPDFGSVAFRKLLGSFVSVCRTMAFAHARGVLHRDLKPANVMVGDYGETLVVDWGLAKLVGEADADEPAPPPDARPAPPSRSARPLPAGSRSAGSGAAQRSVDVTEMGAVLGTPGYMSPEQCEGRNASLTAASDVYALGAMLYTLLTGKVPLEHLPPHSQLMYTVMGQVAPPRSIRPEAPAPLEAVCLKAMAVRPEARYPDARAVADDLERWLADEPVSAWREPWTVQAGRWVRRHRTTVGTVAGVAVMAAAALAAGLVFAESQRRVLDAKNVELETARRSAEEQRDKARAAESDAALRLAQAEATVRACRELADDPEFTRAGMQVARRRLLTIVVGGREELAASAPDPEARLALAEARLQAALQSAALSTKPEAVQQYRRCVEELERLAAEHPGLAAVRVRLVEANGQLGGLLQQTGDRDGGLAALRSALSMADALVGEDPSPRHVALAAAVRVNYAGVLAAGGDRRGAAAVYGEAVAAFERLARDDPDAVKVRVDLAGTRNNLGILLARSGDPDGALAQWRAARETLEALAGRGRLDRELQNLLVACHTNAAAVLKDRREFGKAMDSLAAVQKIVHDLARENPDVTEYALNLARTTRSMGELALRFGRPRDAVETHRDAVAILVRLVKANPGVPEYRAELARTRHSLALALARADPQAASGEFLEAIGIHERLVRDRPGDVGLLRELARFRRDLVELLAERAAGTPAGVDAARQALEIHKRVAASAEATAADRDALAAAHNNLGVLLRFAGDRAAAAEFRTAAELLEALAREQPAAGHRVEAAGCRVNLAGSEAESGDPARAVQTVSAAVEVLSEARRSSPGDRNVRGKLLAALRVRAGALGTLGRHAEAAADWRRALEVNDDPAEVPALRRALAEAEARRQKP
jgi:serine/threonine-protein kinase